MAIGLAGRHQGQLRPGFLAPERTICLSNMRRGGGVFNKVSILALCVVSPPRALLSGSVSAVPRSVGPSGFGAGSSAGRARGPRGGVVTHADLGYPLFLSTLMIHFLHGLFCLDLVWAAPGRRRGVGVAWVRSATREYEVQATLQLYRATRAVQRPRVSRP